MVNRSSRRDPQEGRHPPADVRRDRRECVRACLLPGGRRQTLPGAGKRRNDCRRRPLPLRGRSHGRRHRRQRARAGPGREDRLELDYWEPRLRLADRGRRIDTDRADRDAEDPAGPGSRPRQIRSTSGPCGAPGRATP